MLQEDLRRSADCFAFSAWVSGVAKRDSGMAAGSRCGATKAPASGTSTWAWMSMVGPGGRVSRPGLPWLRAAVAP